MKKKLFSKYPVPTEKELEERMDQFSKIINKSFNTSLDMYIMGVINDIISSQRIILREKKRIQKAKKCIKIGEKLISRNYNSNTKSITKNYYNNLLINEIQKLDYLFRKKD